MTDFVPELFAEEDLYCRLKNSNKSILIYGMGDGAAKIINVLKLRGIKISGIFASDDFVRYQNFMGFTVKKLSELVSEFSDPIILVAFSSKLSDVRENVDRIRSKYELYIPDVNVSGDFLEVFDREFLTKNFEQLKAAYELLCDELSKEFFIELIRYKLTGKVEHIDKLQCRSCLPAELCPDTFVDMGAYTGDTVKEYTEKFSTIRTIIAFEPDQRHFNKLNEMLSKEHSDKNLFPFNAAASCDDSVLDFSDNNGRGSSVASVGSFEGFRQKKHKTVSTLKLDNLIQKIRDANSFLIKIDVEGMEEEAVMGSKELISTKNPAMVVSLYHNNRDIFKLPLLLKEMLPNSLFYISRKRNCFPAWEIELTIIPNIVQE